MQRMIMYFTTVTRCKRRSATSIQARFIPLALNQVTRPSEMQALCQVSNVRIQLIPIPTVGQAKSLIITQSTALFLQMGFSLTTYHHLQKEMLETKPILMVQVLKLLQLRHLLPSGHPKKPELTGLLASKLPSHAPRLLMEQAFQ